MRQCHIFSAGSARLPGHATWRLTSAALVALAAMAAPPAVSQTGFSSETWGLPGGAMLRLTPAENSLIEMDTPFGGGEARLLDQNSGADGTRTLRLSDGTFPDLLGLRWQFFFLDLEGNAGNPGTHLGRLALDRLRAGVAPGAEFLGEKNDTAQPQVLATLEQLELTTGMPEQGIDRGSHRIEWAGLQIDAALLGVFSAALPALTGRLGVEQLGLGGAATITGGDNPVQATGEIVASVNGSDTHRLAFTINLDGGALAGAELRLSEAGRHMPDLREAGRLAQLEGGLIGGAGRGALMAAGFGLAEAGQLADAAQNMLLGGGTLVVEIAPESPLALDDLAAWPERDLAGRRAIAARLGLNAQHLAQ